MPLRCAGGELGGASIQSACSGKCKGGGCGSKTLKVWTLAACNGMVSLFSETDHGALRLVPQDDHTVASSLESLRETLENALEENAFDQLIIVGAPGDVAWAQLALTEPLARRVIAQIHYPLMPNWFKEGGTLKSLANALQHVVKR